MHFKFFTFVFVLNTVLAQSSSPPGDVSVEVPLDCSVDGLYCVDDGQHDHQFYECSINYKGFRQCAPGTKCLGSSGNPYSYNPCVEDPNASLIPSSEQQQSTSSGQKSSEIPVTPSVGTSSEQKSSEHSSSVPLDCSVDGLFCVDDGQHDYQYLECSVGYKGFRQCAPGTKCGGSSGNPYSYNPCVEDPNASVIPSSSEQQQSNNTVSSEVPVTPSVGTSSEQKSSEHSASSVPLDCSVDGLYCVDDGQHDYQYLECSTNYKGFRQCASGTKCLGSSGNPYSYNPCVSYTPTSSEIPVTPSVGTSSVPESETKASSTTPTTSSTETLDDCGEFVCPSDGIFCVIDGKRNNRYCECSRTFNGSRPCAPGTWCRGPQATAYEYNPCVFIDQTTWFGNSTRNLE